MAEVSFIFFYAPWCAHSMAARQEVTQVAMKLAKQVWRHKPLKAGGFNQLLKQLQAVALPVIMHCKHLQG